MFLNSINYQLILINLRNEPLKKGNFVKNNSVFYPMQRPLDKSKGIFSPMKQSLDNN